jgi:hypothetical protein
VTSADWATVASLATALGTLVLAVATFSAVRSGNRTARAAELSLLTSLRPLLTPSRREDSVLKMNFADNKWLRVPGGSGVGEIGGGDGTMGPKDAVVYLALSLRNVGNGIAVLHGWHFHPGRPPTSDGPLPLSEFRMQTRDMYIPPGDIGFWQGTVRRLDDPQYDIARKVVEGHQEWVVDLLYGDEDGGQRVIGRFRCQPGPWPGQRSRPGSEHSASQESPSGESHEQITTWLLTVARHWSIDRPDPRRGDRPIAQ